MATLTWFSASTTSPAAYWPGLEVRCLVSVIKFTVFVALRGLLAQTFEQVLAGNALRKTGEVMAHGNELSAAGAAIDDDDIAPETIEIDGGSQDGPSHFDDAVDLLGTHRAASPSRWEDILNSATCRK